MKLKHFTKRDKLDEKRFEGIPLWNAAAQFTFKMDKEMEAARQRNKSIILLDNVMAEIFIYLFCAANFLLSFEIGKDCHCVEI